MKKLLRGTKALLFAAILAILTNAFSLARAQGGIQWSSVMSLPSADQLRNHTATGRAPYIVCIPSFSGTDGYTDYVVDFRAEYLPVGTYLATCNFDIDNISWFSISSKINNF